MRVPRPPPEPLAWNPSITMTVFWAGQDNPKKNTAKRLEKHRLIHVVESPRELPKRGILLDPFAKKALSKEDAEEAREYGLMAVDCSWTRVGETYREARKGRTARGLPFLVAGNPTKFGRPFELSTAEALAASLVLLGARAEAVELMAPFPWGHTFFDVNREPLEVYEAATTSADVVAGQGLFVADEEE